MKKKVKKPKVKINNNKKLYIILTIIIFVCLGVYLIFRSMAAVPGGIIAAPNPKSALGVGGTSGDAFATWLDRPDSIKYTEFNKHFHPDIEKSLTGVAAKKATDNKTAVITVGLTPDSSNYLKNLNADPAICGTNFANVPATYNGRPMATNLLGNAKVDKNANGIKDNIENLYHALKGCYDNTFEFIGDAIVSTGALQPNSDGSPRFIIRLGHEHDGDWYEWSSNNQTDANTAKALALTGGKNGEQLYVESYRRAHDIIMNRVRTKSGNPNAKVYFEWNGTYKITRFNRLNTTYPGDAYVDVVGIDFYDRQYNDSSPACNYQPPQIQIPDCRTQAEKDSSWTFIEGNLNTIESFAKSKGKLIGVSEVNGSATLATINGVQRWKYGGDNASFVQSTYNWVKTQTDNRRLAYIIFFNRNSGFSAETGIVGAKGYHKLSPGIVNTLNIPAGNANATCALSWDFGGLDGVQETIFPKSTVQFLKLWSGPATNENKKGSHPNCKSIGVVDTGATPTNTKPSISGSTSYTGLVNTAISLTANITDDGLPSPINHAITWTKKSGPGNIVFNPANRNSTASIYATSSNATFSTAGNYVVTLTVSDGSLNSTFDLNVTINNPTPPPPVGNTQETIIDTSFIHDYSTTNFQDVDFNRNIANWTSPINLSTGRAYARLETIDAPLNSTIQLTAQACFYRNANKDSLCSPEMLVPDTSTFFSLGSPNSAAWPKTNAWDFTKAPENTKIILRDKATGKKLLITNCATECSTDLVMQEATPFTMSIQLVIVGNGFNLKALDNWHFDPNCTVNFGCSPTSFPQKPVVSLRHPAKILTKDPSTLIKINAQDNKAITKVELINKNTNTVVGSLTVEPFDINLDTKIYKNGDYILTAKAYDADGNVSESLPVKLKIRRPDIDSSGTVDLKDIAGVINSWNEGNITTKPTNIEFDMNDDGVINKLDLDEVTLYWQR